MAIEITGQSPSALSSAKGEAKAQVGRIESPAPKQETGHSSHPDTVTVSDTAAQLQKLESLLSKLPVIDIARVDNVRQSLNNGNFIMDPQRVAHKMMSFETSLWRSAA